MIYATVWLVIGGLLYALQLLPKPLISREETHYLERPAQGDPETRNVLMDRDLHMVAYNYEEVLMREQTPAGRHLAAFGPLPVSTIPKPAMQHSKTVEIIAKHRHMLFDFVVEICTYTVYNKLVRLKHTETA